MMFAIVRKKAILTGFNNERNLWAHITQSSEISWILGEAQSTDLVNLSVLLFTVLTETGCHSLSSLGQDICWQQLGLCASFMSSESLKNLFPPL